MLAPLITYPYLVRVLGKELYGFVLTAQMLASYFSLIIDFGSNSVCAKHISLNRQNPQKLSEIVCSVFYIRLTLTIVGGLVYVLIVLLVPLYRNYFLLFLLSYGMTFNELLFPQYFYQGIEKMKFITLTNLAIKLIFISLIFIVVHTKADYIYVPVFYTLGYMVAGCIAIWYIFVHLRIPITRPSLATMKFYIKDSFAIFATDIVCTIKDKINYLLVGSYIGMDSVVIYDLGLKINGILNQPCTIIKTALFPRFVQSRNVKKILYSIGISFAITSLAVVVTNIFLPLIVTLFLDDCNIDLLPIRLLTIAPLMLSISVPIASNACIALGYNKYVFYSIIITTLTYLLALMYALFTNKLGSIYSFVCLALISYFVELSYRLFVFWKIYTDENKN